MAAAALDSLVAVVVRLPNVLVERWELLGELELEVVGAAVVG